VLKAVAGQTEVTITPTKRRRRSKLERRQIVEQTLIPGASVARVARAHGVNANQVFAWRKLYERGLLEAESTALMPVRITDSVEHGSAPQPPAVTTTAGVIYVEFGKARVRIEGTVDPAALRAVLECLRG
jgi:transposase